MNYYEVQLKVGDAHNEWITLQDYEPKGLILFDPSERLTRAQAQQRLHLLQTKHPHKFFRMIGPLILHTNDQPIHNERV